MTKTKIFRDPVSGFTHMGGAVVAIVGTVFLGIKARTGPQIAANLIFGISMVLLFAASASYHLITAERVVKGFRKFDHAMIYILIAGTYTPIVMSSFQSGLRIGYMAAIWTIAIVGVILKLFFVGRFRLVSTILYLLMGWSIIGAIVPLTKSIGSGGLVLLLIGGLLYSAGGVIYAIKRPNFGKHFGFHEFFHIFVLLGAIAMFFTVYFFM